ncbi:DUF5050 domain-containing protein [Cytobacillus massiliigabonensis]|uniref:DUF5050 domain-containing protein n=1 Tax=Cytobacillus massiliigabonensis TaxID=1871011 RepID=UPI0015E0BCE8|nr:DUF5050 domain-containing protein [Cytobacillus massiliigabonensis]
MKKWIVCLLLLASSLLFPFNALGKTAPQLEGSNVLSSSFAEKDGNIYYLNNYTLPGKKSGIYKMSKDLKKATLIKQGLFSNIKVYKNSMFVFNDDSSKLQQMSFKGKVIKEYSRVNNSSYVINKDKIYYIGADGFFQINIDGTKNTFIYEPQGTVQEFTINNGWIYFVYDIFLGDEEEGDYTIDEYFAKVPINGTDEESVLLDNINNIDSIIIRNGFIYAVIHKYADENGRNLFRMDLDGKNIKKISSSNVSSAFIDSKYIYFEYNTFDEKQYLYKMTVDGKNKKRIAMIPGTVSNIEYLNGAFYMEIQRLPASYTMELFKVSIK